MLLALTCALTASAQEGIAPPPHGDLRIVGRADGTVYVYHQQRVRQGYGFHVYRTLGGSEQRLTEQPIRGAMNTPEFGAMVGDELPDVLEALEVDDAQRAWLTLRADPIDGTLFSYTYPGVAQALGRLFVDSTAAAGPVGYRIELLDRADEPTGVVLTGEATVAMGRPATPSNLTGESTKAGIALDWTYPEPGPSLADHVPRFHVYERTADGPVRVDERGVLRLDTQDEQGIQLRTDERGATRTFYVVAVDVTGQMSAPTPDLTFVVRDVEPPGFVEGVEARVDRRQAVEVTWPVSPEPDVAGYNVWRAQRTTDPFDKVNGQLLGPFETVYVDSSHTMGGVYYYQVSAVDESGNEGKRSSSVLADVRDLDPPPAPTDLRVIYDPDAEAMTLTWTEAPPAADFKTYVVLRRNTKREGALSRVSIDTLLTTRYVDEGAAGVGFDEGAFYEFGVISEDLGRNVSDTALVRIRIPDTMPPSAPDLSGEVAYGRGVRLLWNAPPEPDAVELLLYRTQARTAPLLDTSAASGAVYQTLSRQQKPLGPTPTLPSARATPTDSPLVIRSET